MLSRTISPPTTMTLLSRHDRGITCKAPDGSLAILPQQLGGAALANGTTHASTLDKLADLLGAKPAASTLVTVVEERVTELRRELGKNDPYPPFMITNEGLLELEHILFPDIAQPDHLVKLGADNWHEHVLKVLGDMSNQLTLRREREQRSRGDASNSAGITELSNRTRDPDIEACIDRVLGHGADKGDGADGSIRMAGGSGLDGSKGPLINLSRADDADDEPMPGWFKRLQARDAEGRNQRDPDITAIADRVIAGGPGR